MDIKEISKRNEATIIPLCQIWEAAVRATHHFLSDDDIIGISKYLPIAIKEIQFLIVVKNNDQLIAFMGVNKRKLEMLFVAPHKQGMKIGKELLIYGIEKYNLNEVCVNEQNYQARGFYEHMGFTVYKRSDLDEQGGPFPILYMRLIKPNTQSRFNLARPEFSNIENFDQFNQYYWYREELKQICKQRGIADTGTKLELNNNIKAYFNGKIIKPVKIRRIKKNCIELSLKTKVLECGFVMNGHYRDYFAKITGVENFKFTANMATALRKVRNEQDVNFTINDLLAVYYGNSSYAKYNNSSCQWNQFLKDFCNDPQTSIYNNKLKVASILWKSVKNKKGKKIYTTLLIKQHAPLLEKFIKAKQGEKI